MSLKIYTCWLCRYFIEPLHEEPQEITLSQWFKTHLHLCLSLSSILVIISPLLILIHLDCILFFIIILSPHLNHPVISVILVIITFTLEIILDV
jgi:hypothetical protein